MEDDCSYVHFEMEDLEDEDDGSREASEHDSQKEESQQGFDYICPPTVKWLLYPDDDDEDDSSPRKFIFFD